MGGGHRGLPLIQHSRVRKAAQIDLGRWRKAGALAGEKGGGGNGPKPSRTAQYYLKNCTTPKEEEKKKKKNRKGE